MSTTLVVAPTADPRRCCAEDGALLMVPDEWALLPPGDPGLIPHVKAAGPSCIVIGEARSQAVLARRLGAVGQHRGEPPVLEQERAAPSSVRRREADFRRREKAQGDCSEVP